MKIAIAQLNVTVGDLDGNAAKISDAAKRAKAAGASLLLTTELALSGYPPEDLLFHRGFRKRIDASLAQLRNRKKARDQVEAMSEPSNASRP